MRVGQTVYFSEDRQSSPCSSPLSLSHFVYTQHTDTCTRTPIHTWGRELDEERCVREGEADSKWDRIRHTPERLLLMTSPNRRKDKDLRGRIILRPISGPNDELRPRWVAMMPLMPTKLKEKLCSSQVSDHFRQSVKIATCCCQFWVPLSISKGLWRHVWGQ